MLNKRDTTINNIINSEFVILNNKIWKKVLSLNEYMQNDSIEYFHKKYDETLTLQEIDEIKKIVEAFLK